MQDIIPNKESLTIEFKSDRHRLPDRELVEAVVCLCKSSGGEIYLGVENDGTPQPAFTPSIETLPDWRL